MTLGGASRSVLEYGGKRVAPRAGHPVRTLGGMDSGSAADWVAAMATVFGFGGAIAQLRMSRSESMRERDQARQDELARREAMARAVGVKVNWQPNSRGGPPEGHDGLMPVHVEVVNSGPYPIDAAVLMVVTDHDEHPMEIVYGTILAGEHIRDTHMVARREVVFGELTSGASLVFTDTYGNHWERSPHGLEHRTNPARIC